MPLTTTTLCPPCARLGVADTPTPRVAVAEAGCPLQKVCPFTTVTDAPAGHVATLPPPDTGCPLQKVCPLICVMDAPGGHVALPETLTDEPGEGKAGGRWHQARSTRTT